MADLREQTDMMKRTCSFADCDRPPQGLGLCGAHWQQQRKGKPLTAIRPRQQRLCSFSGCKRPFYGLGLCRGHWQQQYHGKELAPIRAKLDTLARDAQGRKECSKCFVWHDTTAFYPNPNTKDGLQSFCQRCTKGAALGRLYGLSIDQYEEMLSQQGGVCVLCGGTNRDGRQLFVDHDHETGAPRELLCGTCNRGIGNFRDNPSLLRKAAAYLERHRE